MAVESTAKPDAHRQPKPKPDRASNTDKGSSSTAESMAESEQDQFLALAKQLAELSRLEVASHDALTKRVADLEANLASSRKELAEVRVRNEVLTKQLQAAQPSIEAAARLQRPACARIASAYARALLCSLRSSGGGEGDANPDRRQTTTAGAAADRGHPGAAARRGVGRRRLKRTMGR